MTNTFPLAIFFTVKSNSIKMKWIIFWCLSLTKEVLYSPSYFFKRWTLSLGRPVTLSLLLLDINKPFFNGQRRAFYSEALSRLNPTPRGRIRFTSKAECHISWSHSPYFPGWVPHLVVAFALLPRLSPTSGGRIRLTSEAESHISWSHSPSIT